MRIHKVLSPPHALPGVLVANKIDLAERVQVVPLVRTAAPGLGDHGAPAGATRLHRGLRLRVRLHTRELSLGRCRSPGRRHAARLRGDVKLRVCLFKPTGVRVGDTLLGNLRPGELMPWDPGDGLIYRAHAFVESKSGAATLSDLVLSMPRAWMHI